MLMPTIQEKHPDLTDKQYSSQPQQSTEEPKTTVRKKSTRKGPLVDGKNFRKLLRKKAGTESQQLSMKISRELLARCDAAASDASVSRSAYIKMLITKGLQREGY